MPAPNAAQMKNMAFGQTKGYAPGDATAGGMTRAKIDYSAAINPREDIHYDEKFGASMHSSTSEELAKAQKNFESQVSANYKSLGEAEKTLSANYGTELDKLNKSKAAALGQLPKIPTLEGAFNNWVNTGDSFHIMSGSGPGQDGQEETILKVPKDFSEQYAKTLNENGYSVYGDKIYLNKKGKEFYKAHTEVMDKAKLEFYDKIGPQLVVANKQYNTAIGSINSQYNTALGQLNAEKAKATGDIAGAKASLKLHIEDNEQGLAEIKTAYADKIKSIKSTLDSIVLGQPGKSQSKAVAQKAINAGVSGGYQQE